MAKDINKMIDELNTVLTGITSKEEMSLLLDDLCTYKEIEQMAQRICSARLLMEGKTYSQVIAETDISSATLSRVSKCVKLGKGYTSVIKTKK